MKTQVVINRRTEEIICIAVYNGKAHDRTIFSNTLNINPNITVLADSGYRGIQKNHANSLYPLRHKEDKARMSDEERHRYNKEISAPRMKIEHIIGRIKVFKILSERYRNHRKKFAMRFSLISGIVNYQNHLRLAPLS